MFNVFNLFLFYLKKKIKLVLNSVFIKYNFSIRFFLLKFKTKNK